ncbi:hypothetical protein CXF68_09095 [Tenacibaculum sp. Bg11-29]|uniref:response regulator transcription factor n=1 Tax=Tenacibaculum sp. Bg11-29 TaxID=2058306 RepID=UPI000C34DD3F|nr:response regulator transcription factor [Tenacibaculum sp. Bg11-29]PKH50831.1 hypothetical protein CXF68_09095 [Tenacibaculum sp. Bg11-29]
MKVHIADDHNLILQGFKALLKAHDINVVGTSQNGTELINWLASNDCDVLILDISMPDINGIEILKILKKKNAQPKTIIVSSYDTDVMIYDAIRYGAKGYVLKQEASSSIIEALKVVYSNGIYYSKEVREIIISNRLDTDFEYVYHEVLTKREREVYGLMVNELSPAEIETKLKLSASTIRTHLQKVRLKFNSKSNVNLALIALKYLRK